MAIFQFQGKSLHYKTLSGVLPEDTLFIHGNLGSWRWWKPTMKLAQENYQGETGSLTVVDWLGCGKSSGPEKPEDLSIRSLAQDIIHLVRGLGVEEINVVGHSTGGLIALQAMVLEPDLFSKAVLLDSVAAKGIQFGPEMYQAFTKMSQDPEYCSSVMASTIYKGNPEDSFLQELFADAYSVHPMVWHGIPDALSKVDLRKDITKLTHPTLVLHGEFDTLLPKEGSREIAQFLRQGEFQEIRGHGHCCNIENPGKFYQLLNDFLF